MKRFLLFPVALLCACGSPTSQETVRDTSQPDTATAPMVRPTLLSRFSKRVQQIVDVDSGLVRGFVPGEPLESVMQREKATPDYDSTRSKGYILGDIYSSTEVFEIRYFFKPKSRITDSLVLDAFVNSQRSSDSLMAELSDYFTTRFGQPNSKTKKNVIWQTDGNVIAVRDVGVKQAPGLQVVAKSR